MTKALLTALGLIAMTASAQSAERTYQQADCAISLMVEDGSWRKVRNTCFMGRDTETNATAVKMGKGVLIIKRDATVRGLAKLIMIDRDGVEHEGELARAVGPCWEGVTIKFCSPGE